MVLLNALLDHKIEQTQSGSDAHEGGVGRYGYYSTKSHLFEFFSVFILTIN